MISPESAPAGTEQPLPLESTRTGVGVHWKARLPVRAESVVVRKEVVVYERAVVRRREVADIAHLEDSVRREQLAVGTQGDATVAETRQKDPPSAARKPM